MLRGLVVLLVIAACSSSSPASNTVPAPAEEEPLTPNETATEEAEEAPAPAARSSAPSDIVVVARVLQSGPVGTGDCHQCSHEIAVEGRVVGDPGAEQLWVHYEICAGSPALPAGSENPCSLRVGSTHELTLHRGASPNFGDDPMIVSSRPH